MMTTPHKATPGEWKKVRNWAENESYADSVLLEVADRVAALEEASSELAGTIASADSDLEERITALESQHNPVVDSITDLQGCVNTLEAAATQPPAPAADHSRGATEMVATDEELIETFYVGARGALAIPGFRAVYNLSRQHSAQSRQEEDPSQLSDGYHTFAELYEHRHALFLALMRAMPQHCWFSLRHADGERCFGGDDWFIAGAELPGGSSVTYHLPADLYSLAKATGASRLDLGRPWDGHTASDVVSRLMEWAAQPRQEVEPTPPPAPDGGLVEEVAEAYGFPSWKDEARNAIHAVADWLQQRSSTIANGSRWAEMLRTETDRSSAAQPRPVPQPPAPAGGLVEELASVWSDNQPLHPAACRHALRLVADWLDARGDRGSAAVLRREADR